MWPIRFINLLAKLSPTSPIGTFFGGFHASLGEGKEPCNQGVNPEP